MFRSACLAPPFGIGRERGEATRDLLTSAGKEPITSCLSAASTSPPATSAPIFKVSISWSTSVDIAVDLVASAQGPRHRSARQHWWRLPHSRQPLAATPGVEALSTSKEIADIEMQTSKSTDRLPGAYAKALDRRQSSARQITPWHVKTAKSLTAGAATVIMLKLALCHLGRDGRGRKPQGTGPDEV